MKNDKPYWFKRKRYGWGWIPVTKAGWGIIVVHVAFLLTTSLLLLSDVPNDSFPIEVWIWLGILVVSNIILISVVSKNAPKGKWRWGKQPDDNPDEDF